MQETWKPMVRQHKEVNQLALLQELYNFMSQHKIIQIEIVKFKLLLSL
jgi:hypothetical protein